MATRSTKSTRTRKSDLPMPTPPMVTSPMPRLSPGVDLIINRMQAEFRSTREQVIEEAFAHYAGFLEKIGWLTVEPNGLSFQISRPSVVRR